MHVTVGDTEQTEKEDKNGTNSKLPDDRRPKPWNHW